MSIEQAKAITQAATVDVWNNNSKSERIALMEKYCSPNLRSYPPDGVGTHDIEEVRRLLIVPYYFRLTLFQCDGAYDELHADGREDWASSPWATRG